MFTKIPFKINYPLEILHPNKKVNFRNRSEREKIFKRNIYYYLYGNEKNDILEKRHKTFFELGEKAIDYLKRNHHNLEILSISLFGSSSVLENPGDYDFLAITNGNIFTLEEPILNLSGEDIQTGISIKGIDNYIRGFRKLDNSIQSHRLEQIIDRTAISLFRRHIPIIGKDFVNNEHEFLNNVYAQVSDLLNNSYELFYLKQKSYFIPEKKRAKKMLTRIYEATSYLSAVDPGREIQDIRKIIYLALKDRAGINESKRLFEEFGRLYEEKVRTRPPRF